MYGIELLVEEHKNILKFIAFAEHKCCRILEGEEPDTDLFRECIAFARNYADKHHHGKEEKILFRVMTDNLGALADKLIKNGMLVEHDLGRYHMGELESALNRYDETKKIEDKLAMITHLTGYADLLKRHIGKEDQVVYTFAERMLGEDLKANVNEETQKFEEETKEVPKQYLAWLTKQLATIS